MSLYDRYKDALFDLLLCCGLRLKCFAALKVKQDECSLLLDNSNNKCQNNALHFDSGVKLCLRDGKVPIIDTPITFLKQVNLGQECFPLCNVNLMYDTEKITKLGSN